VFASMKMIDTTRAAGQKIREKVRDMSVSAMATSILASISMEKLVAKACISG